ncbi:MAG: molybdopterin-binding protein [Thermodesulfovibrionales bacterium]|nr:molybdopterin-binding protein [Thermodesulfovibrionales bacterium]
MCEISSSDPFCNIEIERHKAVPLSKAIGCILAHDITEIRKGEFKGVAFKKGHIITEKDIPHLQRLGKENIFVLTIGDDELHEDDAAWEIAKILKGQGVTVHNEPKEGKINLSAEIDGLLKINKTALFELNMLGDLMCATLHNNSYVKKGQIVAGARAIPLVIKKTLIEEATHRIMKLNNGKGIIEVKKLRKFKAGIVITGNEIFHGKVKDSFAEVLKEKLLSFKGDILNIFYAPDDPGYIEKKLLDLLDSGADLLIVTGGMSVDPDDVSRFAIKRLTKGDIIYGSATLPGAMFLVAYTCFNSLKYSEREKSFLIPILGLPACGMYHKTTVFDLILPRILAGEIIGRKELAELGHGGLCLNCKECTYPVCPFGK